MNRIFLKKKSSSHYSYLKTKNNLNGNATSEDEDEDAVASSDDVDENKPKVRGTKKIYEVLKEFDPSVNLKSAEEELKSLGWIKRKVVKTKFL